MILSSQLILNNSVKLVAYHILIQTQVQTVHSLTVQGQIVWRVVVLCESAENVWSHKDNWLGGIVLFYILLVDFYLQI